MGGDEGMVPVADEQQVAVPHHEGLIEAAVAPVQALKGVPFGPADPEVVRFVEVGLDGAANITSFTLDPTGGFGEGDALLDVTDTDATLDLSATAADESLVEMTVICEFGGA